MIAGCMSQSKKILAAYDEILYGSSPEKLVESTHKAISDILNTSEALRVFGKSSGEEEISEAERDLLVRRIVEAVAPIIPVTIRNKALDGTYFRTALQFLGAAELLFSQYDSHIRSQANPAGVVGMGNAMHAEFKRAAVHGCELKNLDDFMKDMKGQYNTSLGLGRSYMNDVTPRNKRRGRGFRSPRTRAWQPSALHDGQGRQGSTWGQRTDPNSQMAVTTTETRGRGQMNPIPIRGRGLCYAFQAGSCTRGGSCRFLHQV